MRRFGSRAYYGDASRLDLLRAARTDKAKFFVLAIDDIEASLRVAETVKKNFPGVQIHARARNRFHAHRLMDLEVDRIVRETFFSSLEMAEQVLRGIYDQTPPNSDGVVRTLLAWSLAESGKSAESAALVARYPHPVPAADGPFDCLAFPRYLSLRPETRELFKQYGGR